MVESGKPFDKNSGRPTGMQISTPLTNRMGLWAKDLVSGKAVPKIIWLVALNGKTDAVEGCIKKFPDDLLKASGEFFNAFAKQFTAIEFTTKTC